MGAVFELDVAVGRIAARVGSDHLEQTRRLMRALVHGPRGQFLLCECTSDLLRDRLIPAIDEALRELGVSVGHVVDDSELVDHLALEDAVAALSVDVVHVNVSTRWWTDERLHGLNVRREAFAGRANARVVFWLAADVVRRFAIEAPDVWAWRTGATYTFESEASAAGEPVVSHEGQAYDGRSLMEKAMRVAKLEAALDGAGLDDEARFELFDELGDLRRALGHSLEAEKIRDAQLALAERLDDRTYRATAFARLAELLADRGDGKEAIRVYREEVLPNLVSDDAVSRANVLRRVANVMTMVGDLDGALRTLTVDVLPAFERLGLVHARAVTMGQIATILQLRGRWDESLRIRREEELPVYEKVGDVRSRAVALGHVADVHRARGEVDEALRIRREEQLPVFERLGDLRSRAVTMGKIAELLEACGDFDEAVRIRRQEELPVYARLGDERAQAVANVNLAIPLVARGEYQAAMELLEEKALPVFERFGLARELEQARALLRRIVENRSRHPDQRPADRADALRSEALGLAPRSAATLPSFEVRDGKERYGVKP